MRRKSVLQHLLTARTDESVGAAATALYMAVSSSSAAAASAAAAEEEEVVELLLSYGADPNDALPASGQQPSSSSSSTSRTAPSLADTLSVPPLLAAVEVRSTAAVRALLKAGADPDRGASGPKAGPLQRSPILLAVVRGDAPTTAALLEGGANCQVAIASPRGGAPETLISVARAKRHFDVLQLLSADENCHVDLGALGDEAAAAQAQAQAQARKGRGNDL